jgi:hypothetical protein
MLPRKKHMEGKLARVVSTKISEPDFNLLEKYAKLSYNQELIVLPTMSNMLRWLIHKWANEKRKAEEDRNKHIAESSSTVDID